LHGRRGALRAPPLIDQLQDAELLRCQVHLRARVRWSVAAWRQRRSPAPMRGSAGSLRSTRR
jgi:hypothetical protein